MAEHVATNAGPVQLSDSQYDFLRGLVELVIPGLTGLYVAVAILWGWGYGTEVAGTGAALTVFGGVLLKFARSGFVKTILPSGGYDGKVVEDINDEGLPILRMELNSTTTSELFNKPQIVIKGFDAGA